jgi:hypothetical protein
VENVYGSSSASAAASASASASASVSVSAAASASAFAGVAGNASANARAYADSAKSYAEAVKAFVASHQRPGVGGSEDGRAAGVIHGGFTNGGVTGGMSSSAEESPGPNGHKPWPKLGNSIVFDKVIAEKENDPFGFKAKAWQQEQLRRQKWNEFNSMIAKARQENPSGVEDADKNAQKTLQDKKARLGKWNGLAWPALLYPENHWKHGQKWEGDQNDGEEKSSPRWRHASKPAYWYKPPPPVKYNLKYDPFGFEKNPTRDIKS